jgi:uncharacterized protein (UPF0147 family)
VQEAQVVEHIQVLQEVLEHRRCLAHIQQSVAAAQVLGTAMHQTQAAQAQVAQELQELELTEAVPHNLFKAIQAVQTLEILDLEAAIMGLPAATVDFILDQVNTPLAAVAVQAVLVA